MTGVLQRAVYATKGLTRTRIGSSVVMSAKTAAGWYFDTFRGVYKTEGMVFAVPVDQSTRAMRGKFLADTYELPERTLAKRHLPPDSSVLELGGCIGVFSCAVNRLLQHPTRHVVVEANPFLIPVLESNRDRNGAAFRIEHGIVSRRASACLSIHPNMDCSRVDDEGIPVATRTIEQLQAAHGLHFDALVMDIEGGEAQFIDEHHDTLRQLRFLMIEFHPDVLDHATLARLRDRLRDAGLCQIDSMLTTEVYARLPVNE